jgi:hypothetical protein
VFPGLKQQSVQRLCSQFHPFITQFFTTSEIKKNYLYTGHHVQIEPREIGSDWIKLAQNEDQ